MLSGDIFYLDYREFKVHFPSHRFVLVGFDDESETAFIADRIRPEAEACSYGALFRSRNPPEGISTHNLWGRFHDVKTTRDLPEAARFAIELCATRMLGDGASGTELIASAKDTEIAAGIAGIQHLAEALPSWGARDDAAWIASYNARVIEKFGNGGGNFRRLYSGFLRWVRGLDVGLVPDEAPDLCWQAADRWNELSAILGKASEENASAGVWKQAGEKANAIAELEQRLFESLAH